MPNTFTNLPKPKSAFLEQFVKLTKDELHAQHGMKKPADARDEFGILSKAVLKKVGGEPLTAKQAASLMNSGVMSNLEWESVAKKSINRHGLK